YRRAGTRSQRESRARVALTSGEDMSKKNASVQIRRDGAPHSARAGSRVARIVASLRRRIAEDYFLFPLFALLLVGSAWVGALHLLEHEREATTQTATQLA